MTRISSSLGMLLSDGLEVRLRVKNWVPAIMHLSTAPQALSPNSLWIYTMNRCTLALFGRALLWRALPCLDFITSLNAVEAA